MGKISSAHDKTNDPKLSKEVAVSEEQLKEDRSKIKTQAEKIREKLKKELEEVSNLSFCNFFIVLDLMKIDHGSAGVF